MNNIPQVKVWHITITLCIFFVAFFPPPASVATASDTTSTDDATNSSSSISVDFASNIIIVDSEPYPITSFCDEAGSALSTHINIPKQFHTTLNTCDANPEEFDLNDISRELESMISSIMAHYREAIEADKEMSGDMLYSYEIEYDELVILDMNSDGIIDLIATTYINRNPWGSEYYYPCLTIKLSSNENILIFGRLALWRISSYGFAVIDDTITIILNLHMNENMQYCVIQEQDTDVVFIDSGILDPGY